MPRKSTPLPEENTAAAAPVEAVTYIATADFELHLTRMAYDDAGKPQIQAYTLEVQAGDVFELPEGWVRDPNYEATLLKNAQRNSLQFVAPSGKRSKLPVKEQHV